MGHVRLRTRQRSSTELNGIQRGIRISTEVEVKIYILLNVLEIVHFLRVRPRHDSALYEEDIVDLMLTPLGARGVGGRVVVMVVVMVVVRVSVTVAVVVRVVIRVVVRVAVAVMVTLVVTLVVRRRFGGMGRVTVAHLGPCVT